MSSRKRSSKSKARRRGSSSSLGSLSSKESYVQLVDLVADHSADLARCSATRLAEATMHRRTGAANYIIQIDENTGDQPISARGLKQLQVAFGSDNKSLADVPLGILITGSIDDQCIQVIRAVAGCSHLSLFATSQIVVSRLRRAMALHHALTHVHLIQHPLVLCDLMQIVSVVCKQLTSLELQSNTPANDEQTALIVQNISSLETLQCLKLESGVVNTVADDLAAVLQLPRLKFLEFFQVTFDQAAMSFILGVLAQRTRPLRALLLKVPTFCGPDAADELLSPAGLQVLRRLYWFELYPLDKDSPVVDLFIGKALPVMTQLRRLVIYVNEWDEDALLRRILAAGPRQEQFSHLVTGWERWRVRDARLLSLYKLIAVLRAQPPGSAAPPSIQHQLEQLERLVVFGSWRSEDVMSVCRDLLPHLRCLTELLLQDSVVLTDALADVLRSVLPRLPSLTEVTMCGYTQSRHLLRLVFSDFLPFSLLSVYFRDDDATKCVVPIQAMRAALVVAVSAVLPSHDLSRYYCHPDHADRPWPSAVPSLHDLCASYVLTQLPPDQDLVQVPEALSRHSLCQQLMPCDGCGAYRRLADGFISVREKFACMIEVLRCFSCYIQAPGTPYPYDVE